VHAQLALAAVGKALVAADRVVDGGDAVAGVVGEAGDDAGGVALGGAVAVGVVLVDGGVALGALDFDELAVGIKGVGPLGCARARGPRAVVGEVVAVGGDGTGGVGVFGEALAGVVLVAADEAVGVGVG
jgi:hypothetical protein